MQAPFLQKSNFNPFLNRRWQIILAGLVVQGIVGVMVATSLLQAGPPDITVAPVKGNPRVCRLVTVEPFTDTWMNGIQPGMLVWSTPVSVNPLSRIEDLSSLANCRSTLRPVLVRVVGQDTILHLNTAPQIDLINLVLTGLLAVVFSLTGMTIFLRASDRPLAHIAYVLFYSASLIFSFLNVRTYLWVNVLLYILSISARGMATTFVCLLPHPARKQSVRISPYTPLVAGIVLALASLPVVILLPQARVTVSLIAFGYTVVCIATLAWVMFWGIRRLSVNEKQMARVVAVGIVVLLLPMTLNPHLVRYNTFVLNSAAHLYSVSLMFLPLVCGYALIRHQLLGTTSLLSRQVMRVLMWLLLASFFVVSSIILLHSLEGAHLNQEIRDYIYAGLLVVNLWLFPLAWSKVRDVGDQLLYHDFYQYNRSLRDLSATLTRLQHLDDICTFVLPRLATLLNATGVALLVRPQGRTSLTDTEQTNGLTLPWRIYHHTKQQPFLPNDRLMSIANLALTHLKRPSHDPLLLDGVLLLPLYAEDHLSGFLCLGSKFNFEPYSRQDTSFLATLAAQLSVLEVNSRYLEQAQADAQKLTALNHRVVSAQEDERRHLALELHDEVLQQAMLLVRQLSDASTMTEVAEAMPLARSLVASLRHTCLELRPPLLDELGLEEALHWQARQAEQHDGLQVMVSCAGSSYIRTTSEVELALYRVVQEALTNVIKHAQASRVMIRLSYRTQGTISLLVWDNGRGFKQGQLITENLGLVGMRERMAAVGGQLQVRAHPGRGVIIRATYRPLVSDVQTPVCEEVMR